MIKFRIWNGFKKEMVYPSKTANYLISLDGEVYRDLGQNIKDKESCEILLSTGLKDCSGKYIYEGDIVEIDSEIFEVLYDKTVAGFVLENSQGFGEWYNNAQERKILGNTYENPELKP